VDWRKINGGTAEQFTANNLNELTAAPNGTPTYDSNGNLTSDGTWDFTYNAENQLTEASRDDGGGWTTEIHYEYDGFRRMRKKTEGDYFLSSPYSTTDTRYVYDGRLVVQERDGSNEREITYVRGNDLSGTREGAGGIGGMLARIAHSGTGGDTLTPAYYHADRNGNITIMIDDSDTVVAKYLYDPFGYEESATGSLASANTYRYSSKEVQTSGLYYYLYRFYHPDLQRWANRDPIEESGGINLYAAFGSNPLLYIDPWGLALQECDCQKILKDAMIEIAKLNASGYSVGFMGSVLGAATGIAASLINPFVGIGVGVGVGAKELKDAGDTIDLAKGIRDEAVRLNKLCMEAVQRRNNK
jgi:RHS repeat-associated protein